MVTPSGGRGNEARVPVVPSSGSVQNAFRSRGEELVCAEPEIGTTGPPPEVLPPAIEEIP